jgi:hypothetical protein
MGSGLPPQEAPVMIAEKRKLFFSFYPRWAQIQMFRQHVHVSKDPMHLQVAFI